MVPSFIFVFYGIHSMPAALHPCSAALINIIFLADLSEAELVFPWRDSMACACKRFKFCASFRA
jgi:hypothetical protein